MKVIINISNFGQNLEIGVNDKTNKFLVNKVPKNINTSTFVKRLVAITLSWKNNYLNSSIKDGESFYIYMENGKTNKTYEGKNAFPSNYKEFKQLISEAIN